jgi:hypothetical protein
MPISVVDAFITGKATEHRLARHAHQIVPTCSLYGYQPDAAPRWPSGRARHQLAIGQQSGIGGNVGTVELPLEAAVGIEPESIESWFTRFLDHHRARSSETRC